MNIVTHAPAWLAGLACLFTVWQTPVNAADWQYPLGVAIDSQGRVLLSDRRFHGVLALQDGELTPVYEGLATFRTPLNAVYCIHVARDGAIFVGDSATRDVYRLSPEGELTSLTSGHDGPAPKDEYRPGKIGVPTQIASNSQGELFVTDLELQRVWKLPAAGGEPQEFAVLAGARGVAVDAENNVWILTAQPPHIRRVSPDGQTTTELVAERTFEFPHQIAIRQDGTALVTDGYGKAVWAVTPEGATSRLASGDPFVNPVGLCLREDGMTALVIDPRAPGLFEVDTDGKVQRLYPPANGAAAP
ncbi:MAG: NHL repeat-containing protein [Planctomyces sp.]|nr:NHL repeat-containing protein [Planctomyces sp.]